MSTHALSIARAYHDAWSGHQYDRASELLADDIKVEVPVNSYPTKDSFVRALQGFGSLVGRVELLSQLGGENEAMLLYDLEADKLGALRVAEHFTVTDGHITQLRQVHDTAVVRAAGLAAG